MDNVLQYIINLVVFVPITIILIVVSIRLSKTNIGNIGLNKYTKVLERTTLSKDTDVFVLKIGDEGCVIVSSSSSIEKIKELSKEEISNIEGSKEESKVKLKTFNEKMNLVRKKSELKEKKDGKLS